MGDQTVAGCKENKAVHAVFPGGCAVVTATGIEAIERAEWNDLGMPETLWANRVKTSGPLIISIDTDGKDIFEINKREFNERKRAALAKINLRVNLLK